MNRNYLIELMLKNQSFTDEQSDRMIFWSNRNGGNTVLRLDNIPIRKLPNGLRTNFLKIPNTKIKELPDDLSGMSIIISKDMIEDFLKYAKYFRISFLTTDQLGLGVFINLNEYDEYLENKKKGYVN